MEIQKIKTITSLGSDQSKVDTQPIDQSKHSQDGFSNNQRFKE